MADGPGPSLRRAGADLRLTRIVLAAFAAYALIYAVTWAAGFSGINDFFVFWSAAQWLGERGLAPGIYDPEAFRVFQTGLVAETADAYRPFAYPPTGLALMAPLAALSLVPALVLFMAASFAFYLAIAAWARGSAAVSLAAAPASLMNLVVGQNGFLTAGLLYGGLNLANRRPWVAGLLIALLASKPQLGLLVPVALLAARQWTCFVAASVLTLAFIGGTVLLGGVEIWSAWLNLLPDFAANTAANADSASQLMVSPPAVFLTLGLPYEAARLLHLPIALGAGVTVWHMCRRFGLTPLSIAGVLAASLLVTPFAYFYDLTIAAVAVMIVAAEALKGGFMKGEKFVLLLSWVAPLMAVADLPLSWVAPLALTLLLWVIWRRLNATPAARIP
ncbi:MAG TPA: glycosyltransferase family 87 protein [Alphaproteobacteria bacterium]|nr:glycosyltransferase family 87 protein [Alphaproteobacteria bacterium]